MAHREFTQKYTHSVDVKGARETVGIIETLDFRLVEDEPLKKIF